MDSISNSSTEEMVSPRRNPGNISGLSDALIIEIFTYIPLQENNLHLVNKRFNSLLTTEKLGFKNLMKLVDRAYTYNIYEKNLHLLEIYLLYSSKAFHKRIDGNWGKEFYINLPKMKFLDHRLFKYRFVYGLDDVFESHVNIVKETESGLNYKLSKNILNRINILNFNQCRSCKILEINYTPIKYPKAEELLGIMNSNWKAWRLVSLLQNDCLRPVIELGDPVTVLAQIIANGVELHFIQEIFEKVVKYAKEENVLLTIFQALHSTYYNKDLLLIAKRLIRYYQRSNDLQNDLSNKLNSYILDVRDSRLIRVVASAECKFPLKEEKKNGLKPKPKPKKVIENLKNEGFQELDEFLWYFLESWDAETFEKELWQFAFQSRNMSLLKNLPQYLDSEITGYHIPIPVGSVDFLDNNVFVI